MNDSTRTIHNLLYRYAEAIDAGCLDEAAELFRNARIEAGGNATLDHAGLLALWRRIIVLYPCGTPRTRHLISNPIVEIDEAVGTATARSCYTVFQATEQLPLQAIASGRYLDSFARIDGQWYVTAREYRLDMVGDIGWHLTSFTS